MALEQILTDSIAHAGFGVALSFLDFFTYKLTNPKTKRVAQKKRCLQAIEVLLDTTAPPVPAAERQTETAPEMPSEIPPDTPPPSSNVPQKRAFSTDSVEYAEQISIVREYLRTTGVVKLNLPLLERVKNGVQQVVTDEKLNNLSNPIKFGVAAGVEILYDIVFDFPVQGASGIAATLYQIPACFVGLWLGNGLKKGVNLFMSSKDERKLDKTIQQLVRDTSLVDLVMRYDPPEQITNELISRGIQVYMSQLTQSGKSMYKHLQHLTESAKTTADGVIHFAQKQQEKEQQARDDRKKRFDDLTRGR